MPTKKFTENEIRDIVFPRIMEVFNGASRPLIVKKSNSIGKKTVIIKQDDRFYQLEYREPPRGSSAHIFWAQDAPEMEFTKEAVIVKKWIPVMEGIPQLKNILEDVWDKGVKQHES